MEQKVTRALDREQTGRKVIDPDNTIQAKLKRLQELDTQ